MQPFNNYIINIKQIGGINTYSVDAATDKIRSITIYSQSAATKLYFNYNKDQFYNIYAGESFTIQGKGNELLSGLITFSVVAAPYPGNVRGAAAIIIKRML